MEKRLESTVQAAEVAQEKATEELPAELEAIAAMAPLRDAPAPKPVAANGLALARIMSISEDGISVRIGDEFVQAKLEPTLELSVLRTALDRGEPVLVERNGTEATVVAGLRLQATPGVDKMREIHLEADSITLNAKREVVVRSGLAAMAVRAVGEIETYAERIVSRAEGVHKIIGRMLRLN